MERVANVNPDRLRGCCQELGITLDALAQAVTVPLANLQNVMDGTPGLTVNQLRTIAEYFGRGILFFLESGEARPEQIHSPQFRTINNQKSDLSVRLRRLVERVERQRQTYLDLRVELGEPAKAFSPPKDFGGDFPTMAAKARRWLGLTEQRDFASYRKAVEDQGVLVFRSNGYNGKWQIPTTEAICGFSLYFPICPVIFIRKEASASRQTFTMMHELGHLLIHQDSFVDDHDDLNTYSGKEKQANEFAANLLIPESTLNSIDVSNRPKDVTSFDDWLKPVVRTLGVSVQALLVRLQRADRISFTEYQAYVDWKASLPKKDDGTGNRSYRHREPKHLFGDSFVRTVLESLHVKNISLARASGYLDNLKITDVHKLEATYADF